MHTHTRRQSRADLIHDRLRHRIVTLDLRPGQTLNEKELCEDFGVSRTPLREAIMRLAEHGMVTVAPQHGTFVSNISPRAVKLAHFLRESLEVPVIRQLAQQPERRLNRLEDLVLEQKILAARDDQSGFILLDDQFHEALFAAAGLAELWSVIHAKKGHLDRVRFLQSNTRGGVTTPLTQHEAVLDAVARGAVGEAEALLREHVAGSLHFLEQQLRDRPDLFIADAGGRSVPASRPASPADQSGQSET
ncbi:GntR family transcriptional regulator [Paracoccus beibuensis]|uniref:GntR family transcriptional regulator n=1 Tax=Paracoccus beibuensis TaxID=547602 RepID=UPI0022401053|nr:GntR family transcriptional regulator [Paracoccus beibuensis]